MKNIFLNYVLRIAVLNCLALPWSSWANQVGFINGNDLEVLRIEGEVSISCREGSEHSSARYDCEDYILMPYEFDYFAIDKFVDADHIKLVCQHEDGSSETKKMRFNAKKQRTDKRINLWINTLFQDPLLEVGQNIVNYELSKKGDIKEGGSVIVKVNDFNNVKTCPRRFITSSSINDCRFRSRACSEYFKRSNYCL